MAPVVDESIADVRRVFSDLWSDGKGWILVVVSLGWFFSVGTRFIYPTLFPFFQTTFAISLSTASLLVSILWMAYALGQFPGGVLGDRIGEGNILVISTLLSVIGITVVAISKSVVILFAGTIAFGFATALYGPTRYTIFTDIYDERAGTAIGCTLAAGSVGNSVLPVAATIVASYASWRLGFSALIPVFIALAIALWFFVPARTSAQMSDTETFSAELMRKVIISIRQDGIPLVLSVHTVAAFINQGFLALYPTYLVEIKGFSASRAAILYGLYFAIAIPLQPAVGMTRDRFGARITLLIVLGVYFMSLLALPLVHGFVTLGVLTLLLSSRNGVAVVTNTFISTALPEGIKGSGLGLLRTVWLLIGATSPAIAGFFADVGYFEEVFFGLALLAGVATALAYFVPNL